MPECHITMKVAALVAAPPVVVILIFPVIAPTGTVAVTCVAEFTVKTDAFVPPKVTAVVWVNPVPMIMTCDPTEPLPGAKLDMAGSILNALLLTRIPEGAVTTTGPLVPMAGTVAVM